MASAMPTLCQMARYSIAFAGILLATGCTVGPNYQRPSMALPPSYRNVTGPARPMDAPAHVTAASAGWWRSFNDQGLTRAVERALSQNLDIAAARARIVQSRAAASLAGAALLPKVDLQASASQVQQSLLDPFGAVARQVPGFERNHPLVDFGAAASWEIDLFGGLRRNREAARAEWMSSVDDLRAVEISIAAETADAYLQLRTAQARLELARRRLAVEQAFAKLVAEAVADGGASERELVRGRAALEGVRASLAPLEGAEAAQSARLDVLMGAAAGAYSDETATDADLPRAPPLDTLGAPADLLRDRPDVASAERRLAAANARIGVAISGYYPKLSLSALIGVGSEDAGRVLVGDALQHQAMGALRWRLFDFDGVDAEVAAARGRTAEALATYRQTVLRATAEVETAVADLTQSQAQAQAFSHQVAELERIRSETREARRSGGASLVNDLDADRELLAASDTLVAAQGAALRAAIAAFRASGGGWRA